jgi:hypothetical protein
MKKVYSYLFTLVLLFISTSYFNVLKSQSLDWAARFSRDVNGSINDYEILDDGSVIVIGEYDGRMKFEGVNSRITIGPTCDYCISSFIARIDDQGKAIWYHNWQNAGNSLIRTDQMELDHNGDIIIGGAYKGIFDLDPSTSSWNTPGGLGLFLIKMDTAGVFINANTLAGGGGTSLADFNVNHFVKLGNEFFMAGDYKSSIDLDPSPTTNQVFGNNQNNNLYLVRYDSNLNFVTKNQLTYIGSSQFRIKAQADGLGNVYLHQAGGPNSLDTLRRFDGALQNDSNLSLNGLFLEDFTFSSPGALSMVGYADANADLDISTGLDTANAAGYFVGVYDQSANQIWKKVFPNVGNNPLLRLAAITDDGQGNTIIGGRYDYDLFLDSTTSAPTNTRNTSQDAFFASFDNSGGLNWSYSNTASVSASFAYTNDLKVAGDKLYLYGFVLYDVLNFNPFGTPLYIPNRFTSLVVQAGLDPFMQKIDLGRITSIEDRTNSELSFKLYPNPAEDEIFVSNASKLRRISLYSISGQRILDYQNPTARIDISSISEGIYLMELIDLNGDRSMQKIVKQ